MNKLRLLGLSLAAGLTLASCGTTKKAVKTVKNEETEKTEVKAPEALPQKFADVYIKEHDNCNKLDELKLREIGLKPSPIYGELKKGKTVTFEGKTINPKEFMLEPIKGKRIIISGDNAQPEILGEYLKDLDLLVHECTYTKEVYDNLKVEILHTTAKDLGVTSTKFGVKNLIATHISPRYHKDGKFTVEMIADEIKASYDGELFIANDFDVFTLDANKISYSHILPKIVQFHQKT